MPATDWLPSERAWLDQLTEGVFTGDIVLVRAIPRWGLTTACRSIAETLGDSAVVVDGRAITEMTQKSAREKIDADVAAAIDKAGCAQLIFDDYGRAVRRSQGGALPSMLYRLLVDSDAARDTGALLVARSGDMLDLNFSGSPLISGLRPELSPRWPSRMRRHWESNWLTFRNWPGSPPGGEALHERDGPPGSGERR